MSRFTAFVAILALAVVAFVGWNWRHAPFFERLWGSNNDGQLVAEDVYQCNGGKIIQASVYQGEDKPGTPETPPVPGGRAKVVLSDGRTMELAQTISADGARYASEDESFVFWNRGNGALVLENNQEKSYIGCVRVADDPGSLPQVYTDSSGAFSVRYPKDYSADEKYVYQNLGPGKNIYGTKFTIDPKVATGTNLSSDSYISIEQMTGNTQCSAGAFLEGKPTVTQLSEGNTMYSYASTTGAAAGNRYEEIVFAIPGTNPCTAVRYFIHYGAIENYPEGAVRQFDRSALISQFDAIRKTLIIAP